MNPRSSNPSSEGDSRRIASIVHRRGTGFIARDAYPTVRAAALMR